MDNPVRCRAIFNTYWLGPRGNSIFCGPETANSRRGTTVTYCFPEVKINKAQSTRAIFMWQFLFARVDEKNWLIFIWQLYLLKNGRVSFYVANKNCHIQKIVRVDETTHKIGNYFNVIRRSQSPIFCFQIKIVRVNWLINKTCHIKIVRVGGAYPSK